MKNLFYWIFRVYSLIKEVREMNSYIEYIKQKLKDNLDVKYRIVQMTNGRAELIFIDN
jgi:hypothetical protein